MVMLHYTKFYHKNLEQSNVILTCIQLKGLSEQVQLHILFQSFLLKNQVKEFDFVLTIKD